MLKKLLPRKQQTKLITFTNTLNVSKEYAPKPSIHFIPQWYKEIEASFPKERKPSSTITIKKCIPVLDAMTSGYIIVSPCDVYVCFQDGEPNYTSALPNLISFHPRKQAYKHPMANDFSFPKWFNPWAIRTPVGYSCLFVPPMHNPNPWFEIMPGIVDTDEYYSAVNFPFVLKNPTHEFMIPAGTPVAQVIPLKRDVWNSEFDYTNKTDEASKYLNSQFFDRYKKMFWNRKNYS